MAAGLTAFVLALAIRGGLHLGHTESGWLLPLDFVLRGWPLIAVNVAFYGYLCWLGFSFIRGTAGPERLFMVGWFASILLSPLDRSCVTLASCATSALDMRHASAKITFVNIIN
jgi:hypothetical protein